MTFALACSLLLTPQVDLRAFVGRYVSGQHVLTFDIVNDRLCVKPLIWSSRQTIAQRSGDEFFMDSRPSRTFQFLRSEDGTVQSVEVRGMDMDGQFARTNASNLPLELILDGKPIEAEARFQEAGVTGVEGFALVTRLAMNRPNTPEPFVRFLRERIKHFPDAAHYSLLGQMLMSSGQREEARAAYSLAIERDPQFIPALSALRMFKEEAVLGWKAPFSLSEVYQRPTNGELRRVEKVWKGRDLSPSSVQVDDTYVLNHQGARLTVSIVSHLVHGQRHYGAIIVPEDVPAEKMPLILDLKGVNPSFSPLSLPEGSTVLEFLGSRAKDFVIVIPSFRGEQLLANGKSFMSEGNPEDSWDGATDDAIALLNVALARIKTVNQDRIAVFGRSRGGTVALLTGIRDKRIDLVLAWSAPAGWIENMVSFGWKPYDYVREALRPPLEPPQFPNQAVRTFLKPSIESGEGLEAARNRLIASSPIYFLQRLPRADVWYGLNDSMVQPSNGRALQEVLARDKSLAKRVRVSFYDGGHDLDPPLTGPDSRKLLVDWALKGGT